ncbi:MAG: hypothetical protein ACOYL6_14420 [Bacteriovoracaceae bacterium]
MNRLIISLFISIIMISSALAQDLDSEENKYLGYIYQQQNYQLEDARGDILLLWTAHQIPLTIMNHMRGKEKELRKYRKEKVEELLKKYPEFAPQEETKNLIVESYVPYRSEQFPLSLEGHKAPFNVGHVVNMFKQVIVEEFQKNQIIPSVGQKHTWSTGTRKKYFLKFPLFSNMSKLLVALSRGVTSNFMMTGKEEELKDYIISRPQESINLEEMFRASYRINKGDVYLTLLSIENVLSRFWTDHQRARRLITTKLKDITNFYYMSDKFGSWYHLFGMILFGYAEGGLKGTIIGKTETIGSHIMGGFQDEEQEDFVNRKGSKIGGRLKRFVQTEKYLKFNSNSDYIKETYYMSLDEDFSKRLDKAQRKQARRKVKKKEISAGIKNDDAKTKIVVEEKQNLREEL